MDDESAAGNALMVLNLLDRLPERVKVAPRIKIAIAMATAIGQSLEIRDVPVSRDLARIGADVLRSEREGKWMEVGPEAEGLLAHSELLFLEISDGFKMD